MSRSSPESYRQAAAATLMVTRMISDVLSFNPSIDDSKKVAGTKDRLNWARNELRLAAEELGQMARELDESTKRRQRKRKATLKQKAAEAKATLI